MDRFRLFRSRAFWFGVPGLVGLLWGWWVSTGYHSWVEVGSLRDWELGQTSGHVYAFWYVEGWPNWREVYAGHEEASVDDSNELKQEMAEGREAVSSFRYIIMGHHWLAAGYLVSWCGLVFWRSRRFSALAAVG